MKREQIYLRSWSVSAYCWGGPTCCGGQRIRRGASWARWYAIEDVGFLASIPLWLVTLLGCLLITVLAFLMILTVYGRFFKLYLYAALSPVALASFAGEGTSQMGRAFLKSYMGVCLEGAVIVLACIVFSAFAASDTVVLGGGSVVTQVWGYLGEVIFNMLVLVGLVKGADRVVREMFGM